MVEGKQSSSFMKVLETDNLRKREQFAVSLRAQKRKQIINAKRKRLPTWFTVGTLPPTQTVAMRTSQLDVVTDH